jgi:prevent-host-death family protein
MAKTVSATEAKTRFGTLMEWAVEASDEVIVESRGEPKVVIMAFAAYEQLRSLREQARREQALARLEQLRDQLQARQISEAPEALSVAGLGLAPEP